MPTDGEIVFVTGGASGIGLRVAGLFAERGAAPTADAARRVAGARRPRDRMGARVRHRESGRKGDAT